MWSLNFFIQTQFNILLKVNPKIILENIMLPHSVIFPIYFSRAFSLCVLYVCLFVLGIKIIQQNIAQGGETL